MQQEKYKDGPKMFYGYIIVGAASFIMAITWGANRSFGVFLKPMLSDLGWTRAGISGAFTFAMIIMGMMGTITGKLTDQLGPRVVAVGCGLFLGIGYILMAWVRSVWQLYVIYGLLTGIGMSISISMLSLSARWFVRRRALMTGIIAAGPSLGIFLVPLACSRLIDIYGWRTSYVIMGIFTIGFILFGARYVRRSPADSSRALPGEKPAQETDPTISETGFSIRQVLRTKQYWLLSTICFCDLFLMNVVTVHLVIHAQDQGVAATQAATLLSAAAGVCLFARIAIGGVADRIGCKPTLMICLVVSMLGFVVLLSARGMWMLYLFAVIFGFSLWASGGLIPPITAELFGLKAHGNIFGAVYMSAAMGGAFGPVLVGYLYDVFGSYQPAFGLCLLISICSVALLILLDPVKK